MKIRLPVLVKDPSVAGWKGVALTQNFDLEVESEFWLDGPVARRVAIVDFDPQTGQLGERARFVPPAPGRGLGRYELPCGESPAVPSDLRDPRVRAVLTFAGVYKTIRMFEEEDCLGREVDWAFAGPQLLVVPRAGEWANAFYERESRSLQFFFFQPAGGAEPVHTSSSMDIVAHETAHAVIDGVAPDLYDATSPEALAIHEAMADVATVVMAFRSRELVRVVLEQTGNSIASSNAFTGIAGEFGEGLRRNGRPLRELANDLRLDQVDHTSPHALSEVLSGALYRVMGQIYEARRLIDGRGAEGRSLAIAADLWKRMVFRALDYLPPGEIGFADYARALLAADEASHPGEGGPRTWLMDEFVRRGIAAGAGELDLATNVDEPVVRRLDLDEFVRSDWLAYRFVDRNRALLGVPPRGPFVLRPRLDVTKLYYHQGEVRDQVRECLAKVSWTEEEESHVEGLPGRRRVIRGATLAIGWDSKLVRAIVRGGPAVAGRAVRDAFVKRLIEADDLETVHAPGAAQGVRRSAAHALVTAGTYRLRGTARSLHVCGEGSEA